MGRTAIILVLCASALAGCRTAAPSRVGAPAVSAVDEEIAREFGKFIDLAMNENYEGINGLVVPSQAVGFDARAFAENRFRMKVGSFQIVVWDKKRIGVTPVKGKKYYLSSAVAHVRILATNEVRPVYVNLYWVKESGRWWILPFPETP